MLLKRVKELKEVVELSEKANDLESDVNKLKRKLKHYKISFPKSFFWKSAGPHLQYWRKMKARKIMKNVKL